MLDVRNGGLSELWSKTFEQPLWDIGRTDMENKIG
jgi:hypothetical protein